MGLLEPTPTPYDPVDWVKRPLAERARMVCEARAIQGYGTQPFGRSTLSYRIVDAKSGVIDKGDVEIARLRAAEPWKIAA
jgi:hypothetical protein